MYWMLLLELLNAHTRWLIALRDTHKIWSGLARMPLADGVSRRDYKYRLFNVRIIFLFFFSFVAAISLAPECLFNTKCHKYVPNINMNDCIEAHAFPRSK